jgi:uncharacterized membrane protein
MSMVIWIILAGAVATYVTRIAGDVVLSRFHSIPPRVEAGLNAVPAAVMTSLFAPSLITGGVPEIASLAVTALATLRGGAMTVLIAGWGSLVVLRYLLG